ncbi:MAG: hypothetical protein ACQEVA_13920 [Myxococcota bacterium]
MSRLPTTIGIVLCSAALACVGCESDKQEFDGAPSATAPSARAPAPDEQAAQNKQRTDKPTNGEMPADHPPVGAAQGQQAGQGDMPAAPGGGQGKRDGTSGPLRWEAPEGWKAVKPASDMRYAEYLIEGGSTPLSLTIFYFGPSGGGSVEQNIERWTGQFDSSSGTEPEVDERTVNGMTLHTVDVSGTYDAGAAMGGGGPKKSQRMLGAIVEAPTGNYFIKLVGPEGAVSEQTDKFEAFISSFKSAS